MSASASKMKDAFTHIYRTNMWRGSESRSGTGSSVEQTRHLLAQMETLFEELNIKRIVDVPCGDFNWMQHFPLQKDMHYTGGDIVDELIESNIKKYKSDNVDFKVIDITQDSLPDCDIIIVRDGIAHLPLAEVHKVFENIKKQNYKYMLISNYKDETVNREVQKGWTGASLWNLEFPPFNLPPPMKVLSENSTPSSADTHARKYMCLWSKQDFQLDNAPGNTMKYVVSFTTSPTRIHQCDDMLNSIFQQTRKADMVVLNIPDVFERTGEKYEVPEKISSQITVNHCGRDWGPATKIVPTVQLLREQGFSPDNTRIIYLDDDMHYQKQMIESLESVESEDCVWGAAGFDFVNLKIDGKGRDGHISIVEAFNGVCVKLSVFKDDFIAYMDTHTKTPVSRFSDDVILSNYFHKVGVPIKKFSSPGKYSFMAQKRLGKDSLHHGADGLAEPAVQRYVKTIEELDKLNERYFDLYPIEENKPPADKLTPQSARGMKKFSILVPTRNRPVWFKRLTDSVYDLAEFKERVEMMAYVDLDDPSIEEYRKLETDLPYNTKFVYGDAEKVSERWNILAAQCAGDVLIMGADDAVYRTKHWDTLLEKELTKYPDDIYCAWMDDRINGKNLCAFPIVSRLWYETLGYFLPEELYMGSTDTWVHDIAKQIDRCCYIPNIVGQHLHMPGGELDDTYSRNRADPERGDLYADDNAALYRQENVDKRLSDAKKLANIIGFEMPILGFDTLNDCKVLLGRPTPESGGVSRLPENIFQTRCKAAKAKLVKDSLHIKVKNMRQALDYLGQPDFETDQSDHSDNPLRWWRVELTTDPACDMPSGKTFVVRHARTGPAGHLDVLSEVHFRTTLDLNGNSTVQLRRVKQEDHVAAENSSLPPPDQSEVVPDPKVPQIGTDVKVTTVLNVYKRVGYLSDQIGALRSQTVPTNIWIDYTIPKGEAAEDLSKIAPEAKITTHVNQNLYHIGRFYHALNVSTEYVFICDDDIIPGKNYIQHCINTMEDLGDCVLTGFGICLKPGKKEYAFSAVYGWNQGKNQKQIHPMQVDMAGHSWFFKRKYLSCLTREEPITIETGEDLHFSYCMRKYANIPIYVPPHVAGEYDNWSCQYEKGKKYGGDKHASAKKPGFFALRSRIVAHYVDRGWVFVNDKQESKYDMEARISEKPSEVICGTVVSGSGGVSRIPEGIFQARCKAAKAKLVKGSLNVKVEDMQQALGYLGQPDFETDQSDHTDNPLRWWQVELTTAPACDVPPGKTFVVRHARTGPAGHLDVLSEVHFRTTLNLNDNSMVQLRRVPGVWQPGVAAVMCLSLGGYPGSLKAVHSLKGQVDTLYLCLNDFWEVPEELKQDWIDILHFGHDFGDAARFYLLKNMGSVDTHIIACAGNIEYPAAYVKDFLAAHKKYPDAVLAYAGERVYTDKDEIKLESCSNLSHQKPEPLYMNIPGSDVSFIPKSVFNRLEFSSPMHSDQIEAHLGANCANLGVPVIGLPANEKYGELLGSRPDSAADPSDRIREIHGIYASYGLELKPSSASVSDALKGKDDAVTAPRESDAESPPLPINSWAWLRPNLRNPRLYLLGNNQHAGDKIRALCKILKPEDCVVHFNRAFWAGEFQDHPNNVLVLRYPGSINPGGEKFHNQGAIHNPQFKAVYFIVPVHPDSPYREPQALKDCKLPKALVRYAPGTLFANISIGSPASPSTGFITWFMNQMLDPVLVGFTSLKELDGTSPADHSSGHEEAYLNAHAARYFGADGNLLSNRPSQLPEQAQALMRTAVREGRLDLLDHLLQSPETDINQPDASGQTALVEAVIRSDQQFEMFEHLLGVEGIDIFQPGFNRFDPLGMAIHRGAVEVIKRLLADPRMTAERRSALPQDFLALVSAPREMHINKRVACLNRLLGEPELAKFLGPARDAEKRNALLLTVERPFSPDHYQPDQHGGYEQFIRDTGFAPAEYRPALLEALLACPAIEVTAVDKHGNNALHLAAANKHPRCVEMLLEDGRVDSQSRNAEGLTPLDCAEQVKHKAIIEKLKAHKPADNPPPESLGTLLPRGPVPPDPSDAQSQAWQREFLEWITGEKGGSFDQRCNTLRLLHKKRKWAKLLAPARDADNLTALLRVIEHKGTGLYRPDILRILLSLPEMDLTATDNHGNNALHLAAAQGNARAVTYLLGDGRFDLEARNNAGQTPLECAEQEGHAVVAAQLQARAENLALPRVKPSRPSVPKKEKLTFVTVLTSSGGEYLPEHVERLRQGIARHCSIPHRFFCLSDQPLHCPWIPLTEDWEGWWSKLEIFKHDLGPTVYFDLDTLIVDNLDWMVDAPKQFSMIKDFRETYHNSGVMAWTGDKYRHIADTFKPKEVPYYHARWPGDGGWIREQMPDSATLQKRFPDKIISWKISGWSAPGASVLCFYGTPRPWEVAPPVDVHPGSDCQMISGKIVSGCGSASRIPDELFRARCEAAEAKLTRGTLNIKVGSLKQALDYLGKPDFETDQSSKKLGPLRWWQVELIPEKAPDGTVASGKTFVVRHHRTGTGELEVMSEIHFRTEAGLDNHSAVRIRRLKQEKIKFEMPPGHGSGYVRKHPVFYKLWLKEAGYEYVETMNFPGESMFYFAVNGMRGVIDFHNFADARNKEAPNWDYEDLTVPIFKSHYSRDITYPKNFFPLAPTLCQYGHGRAGMVADLVGLLTDPSFEITPQVGFTCKQEPRGKALHRRNKVRGLLKEHFPDTDLKFNNPPLEFWNMHKTKLAAICVPGLTNNMLDRGQAELMMLGVCTISPYLPEVLLGDVRPEPNVDYLQCADDYSDLIDICKSLTPERAKQIGDNARRKMAALQPKPFWDYVIRTLQDWYHKKPANDAESPPESVSSKAATTNMIRGKLVSGQGKISRLPNAVLQARSKAADAKLVKGSLNVRVDNMKQTLDYLGSPDFVIPQANGNDLRWWQVKLSFESKCEAPPGKTFVVRHTRTGPADYLDVLSETHFRSELNLTDGASVLLRKAHSKDFVGVIATMCMWHPRWPGSMKTVLSLEGQVDTLYLCLNDFSEVPEELKQDWIEILHFGENLGDAPRVYLLRNSGLVNAHVITCDDDIEYPATYVQDFLAAHKEYPNTLLTHHGDVARFKDGEFQRYAWGLRIVGDDHEAKRVCLPGSGVSFIPADIFNQMEFTSLVYFNQLDVHIACNCHKLGIPMIGLSHAKGYIKYTPPPGRTVHKTVTQAHNRIEKVRQIYASYGLNINEIPEEERELEGVRNRPLPSEIQASPEFQPAATRRKIMEQRPELDWEQVEKQCQTVYEMFHQPGPKSLVRAGDGELNLLRRKTSEFLALGIADAMKHADCLGLPDHHQPGRTDHEWKTGLIDALRDDYQTEVDQSPHVSAFLFYVAPELIGYLAAGKRVLWITHGAENIVKNMKNPAFRDYYGLHDIADNYWINTVGRRSGPFPAENEQNVMADIRQKLSEAQDFDLACVGAGAIGKMTCQHIKTALGKTAIDIGGVMSAMQGVRNYTTFRRGGWLNPLVWDPGQVLEAPETNTSNDSITESELEQPASMFTFSSMPDSNYAKVHPTFYKLWLKAAGHEYTEIAKPMGVTKLYFEWNGLAGVICFSDFAVPPHDTNHYKNESDFYKGGKYSHLPLFKAHYSSKHDYPDHVLPFAPTLFGIPGDGRRKALEEFLDFYPSFETAPKEGFTSKQRVSVAATKRRREMHQLLKQHFPDIDLKSNDPPRMFWNAHKTKLAAICIPGATNNMLDRAQMELMMLGVCTISPYLPEVLLGDIRLEPNEDYLQCADDYSDLIDICKSLTPERAKQIGNNARAKLAPLQPKPFWDYVIRTLKEWYETAD